MYGQGTSHLFHRSRQRRPRLTRAKGICAWGVTGKRHLDGSAVMTVSNIGHSCPNVPAPERPGRLVAGPGEARAMQGLKGAAHVGF